MEKITIEKEKINPLVGIATKRIGKTNDEIGQEIGKSAMIFTQIKNQRNLVGFETLGLMRKRYGLNINAIVDEDVAHLFDEYNFDDILLQLDQERKEKEEIKKSMNEIIEERDSLREIAISLQKVINGTYKDANFNEGDINGLLADRFLMMCTYPLGSTGNFNIARPTEIN